jgi:signal peptidase I
LQEISTQTPTQSKVQAPQQYAESTEAIVPRPKLQRRSFLREIIDTLVLIAAIYSLVNLASARFIVQGPSMQPNFHTGEFLIVSRLNYLLDQPQRGDIVVFHYPGNPEEDYIKRVIGLPGDTVEIRDTLVYVNDVQLDEPYINEPCEPGRCRDEVWTLGLDEYFVMGDNRNHSSDSRAFGPVNRQFLVGEALVRYWPPSEWGLVTHIAYPDD